MQIGDTRKLKIVYYSAHPTAGRQNLEHLQATMSKTQKREPAFDDSHRLEVALPPILGRPTTLELETVPPTESAIAARIIQLKDADGVIFIADDADKDRTNENLAELRQNLEDLGCDVPLVFQYTNLARMDDFEQMLGSSDHPAYVIDTESGVGIVDTLKAITKLVISKEPN